MVRSLDNIVVTLDSRLRGDDLQFSIFSCLWTCMREPGNSAQRSE